MSPLVSVIIVNYNASSHLLRAVTSVLKLKNTELILFDNASTDDSLAHLPRSSRLTIIRSPQNLGFAAGVNRSVRQARGHNLFLLNPDATLTEEALELMLSELSHRGGEAIIAPRLLNPNHSPQPSCYHRQSLGNAIKEYWFGHRGAYSKYLPSTTTPTSVDIAVAAAYLTTRQTWDRLGGLDEKFFLYFEDLDFCDRARQLNIPIIYLPTAKVVHAHGVSSAKNEQTSTLFLRSALTYHGRLKKFLLDLVIRTGNLLRGSVTPKKTLVVWLLSFVVVLLFATLSYFLLPSRFAPAPTLSFPFNQNFLWWGFTNFDGEHYLSIAAQGYQEYKGQSQYAFFPLLPLLIHALGRSGIDHYLAARFLTLTASLFAAIFMGLWLKRYLKAPLASLWMILLGSGSIFLFSVYTEPLFLLLVSLTFYFNDQKRWSLAILTATFASATRVNGIFLIPYLFVMLRTAKTPVHKSVFLSLLPLAGIGSYMLYLNATLRDPLAWFHSQADWGKANPTSPFETLVSYATTLTTNFQFDLTHLVVLIEVFVTLLLWYLLIYSLRRKFYPPAYHLYCLGNLALPLATGSLGSMPRFALAVFPLLALLPTLTPRLKFILSSLFILAGMMGTILFMRGYWYA